jgi:hypothetical protein
LLAVTSSSVRRGTPKSFGAVFDFSPVVVDSSASAVAQVIWTWMLLLPAPAVVGVLVIVPVQLLLLLLLNDSISLSFPSKKERVEALGVAESQL